MTGITRKSGVTRTTKMTGMTVMTRVTGLTWTTIDTWHYWAELVYRDRRGEWDDCDEKNNITMTGITTLIVGEPA